MIQYPPWQNLIKDDSGKIIGKSGLIFEVLNQISHKLNFSYSVREPADGKWGVRSGAGEWNGMMRHRIFISTCLDIYTSTHHQSIHIIYIL